MPRGVEVEQLRRGDVDVVARALELVGRSPSTLSNSSSAMGTRSGWATQVPSKPSPASRCLSACTAASAVSLTAGSRRLGMNAAMPPMACAPRRWHVRTSSSVYARMNGTVMVSRRRSGSTAPSSRAANVFTALKR